MILQCVTEVYSVDAHGVPYGHYNPLFMLGQQEHIVITLCMPVAVLVVVLGRTVIPFMVDAGMLSTGILMLDNINPVVETSACPTVADGAQRPIPELNPVKRERAVAFHFLQLECSNCWAEETPAILRKDCLEARIRSSAFHPTPLRKSGCPEIGSAESRLRCCNKANSHGHRWRSGRPGYLVRPWSQRSG